MIRKLRRARDITQSELAKAMGVERSTVAKWEQGKSNPKAGMLVKLAEFFGCSIDELMGKHEKSA